MQEHGSIVIQELTGSWPVYPGHPLVLATAIMSVFSSFDEAQAPSGHGYSTALADSRIPGAGDHVGAAMRVLERGAAGQDADAMVKYAREYWIRGQAGGHNHKVQAGVEQADAIEPHFRSLALQWFAGRSATAAA